jgi:hypothetical protein
VKQPLLNACLLAVSVLIGGIVLEVGVLVFLGEQPKFPRHVVGSKFGLRINQPNCTYRQKSKDVSVQFRINAKGMRSDRNYPYQKPAGLMRILSLGDSFTIGYEVSLEETFSSVLEKELRSRGYRVEVINAGVSGYGTAEECLYLERELFRYQPDLVILTFYGNDLSDNVRAGLFEIRDGHLIQAKQEYVPLGGFGDFLNTNLLLSFLSENSNAFALIKEDIALVLKGNWVRGNLKRISDKASPTPKDASTYEATLAAAILERVHTDTGKRGIPLIIQDIPYTVLDPPHFVDVFPASLIKKNEPNLYLLPATDFLAGHLGKEPIIWEHSHGHWTPMSHRLSGQAIAELIIREKLLVDIHGTSNEGRRGP